MTMVKVLVLDDPVTTMQFVLSALQEFFGNSEPEAWQTTLRCHLNGEAVCAIYWNPAEADHFVGAATEFARWHGHPLSFVTRPIPDWERVAGYIFAMVIKIAPNYRQRSGSVAADRNLDHLARQMPLRPAARVAQMIAVCHGEPHALRNNSKFLAKPA